MENNVRIMVLKNGMTLLGQCDLVSNNQETRAAAFVNIKQPVVVVPVPGRDGVQTISFMPFLQFTEEFTTGIPIDMQEVMTFGTPVTDMLNSYNQIFGSGIQIAKTL